MEKVEVGKDLDIHRMMSRLLEVLSDSETHLPLKDHVIKSILQAGDPGKYH